MQIKSVDCVWWCFWRRLRTLTRQIAATFCSIKRSLRGEGVWILSLCLSTGPGEEGGGRGYKAHLHLIVPSSSPYKPGRHPPALMDNCFQRRINLTACCCGFLCKLFPVGLQHVSLCSSPFVASGSSLLPCAPSLGLTPGVPSFFFPNYFYFLVLPSPLHFGAKFCSFYSTVSLKSHN